MIRHALGPAARALIVLGGIVLASSGSQSARAEPLASPSDATGFLATLSPEQLGASDAPVCRVTDPTRRSASIDTGARIAQIQALIAAQAAASGAAEEGFVAISNRGYNYQPDTIVDPALLEFEARQSRR